MEELVKSKLELFISNFEVLEKEFKLESRVMIESLAFASAIDGVVPNCSLIKETKKKMVDKETGFKLLKSVISLPYAYKLSKMDDYKEYLSITKEYYSLLKANRHFDNNYLAISALSLAKLGKVDTELVFRSKVIFELMKKNHPYITNDMDMILATEIAKLKRPVDSVIKEMEECYNILLKPLNKRYDDVQALSHVLTLSDSKIEDKCNKVLDLYNKFNDKKYKITPDCYLTLGLFTNTNLDSDKIVNDVIEITEYLKKVKRFKWTGKNSLIRFALILESCVYLNDYNDSYIVEAVNEIIQQQVMMMIITSTIVANTVVNS